uniref:F-box domain-containing protein n=1 Tax=Parastrongyloides trichosuri TaxID=131310 RepID=A0A0N4ZBV1_PARTI
MNDSPSDVFTKSSTTTNIEDNVASNQNLQNVLAVIPHRKQFDDMLGVKRINGNDEYRFVMIVSDNFYSSQQLNDFKFRIIFLNSLLMKREIDFLKTINANKLSSIYEVNFCIEDRRTTKTLTDTEAYGVLIAKFIEELFEIFKNASTLYFTDYNKNRVSSIYLHTIANLSHERIKKVLNINVLAIPEMTLFDGGNEPLMFQNLKNLEEIGFFCDSNNPLHVERTLVAYLQKLDLRPFLIINLLNYRPTTDEQSVWFILNIAFEGQLKVRGNLCSDIDGLLDISSEIADVIHKLYLKTIIELKLTSASFLKIPLCLPGFENLESIEIYICANTCNGLKRIIRYETIGSRRPCIYNLSTLKNLKEVAITFHKSTVDCNVECFEHINILFYILNNLPIELKRLWIISDGLVTTKIMSFIEKKFINLSIISLCNASFENSYELIYINRIEMFHLNNDDKFEIPKDIKGFIINKEDISPSSPNSNNYQEVLQKTKEYLKIY